MECPFLYLKSNIDKLDIDERLKPLLSQSLDKMSKYFTENNYLDVLDACNIKSFFDEFLIKDSDNKIKFIIKQRTGDEYHSYYDHYKRILAVNEDEMNSEHIFIHEFFHLLAWKSNTLKTEKQTYHGWNEAFFDEGFTEYFARKISGEKPNEGVSRYNENVEEASFLSSIYGEKYILETFLSNQSLFKSFFALRDDYDIKIPETLHTLLHFGKEFYDVNKSMNINNTDNFRKFVSKRIEGGLILKARQKRKFSVNNIVDLVNNAIKLSNRNVELKDEMDKLYKDLTLMYMKTLGEENLSADAKSKLFLAVSSLLNSVDNMYLYGDNGYAYYNGFKVEDFYIPFHIDKDGYPIKSDYHISKFPNKYFASENSNKQDRKVYSSDIPDLTKIDFDKEKIKLSQDITMRLNSIMQDPELSKLVIENLFMSKFNVKISDINDNEREYYLSILEKDTEPILFNSIKTHSLLNVR